MKKQPSKKVKFGTTAKNPLKPCSVCGQKTKIRADGVAVCAQHIDDLKKKGDYRPFNYPEPIVITFAEAKGVYVEFPLDQNLFLADLGKIAAITLGEYVTLHYLMGNTVRDIQVNMTREQFYARLTLALRKAKEELYI